MRYDFVLKATLFYASLTRTCIMLILSVQSSIFFLALKRSHRGNKILGGMDQHLACSPLWIFIGHFSVISQVFSSKHLFRLICDQNSNWEKKTLCVCVGTWTYTHMCSHLCNLPTGIFPVVFFSLFLRPSSVFQLSFYISYKV